MFSTLDSTPTIAQLKQFPGTDIEVIDLITDEWKSIGKALDFDETRLQTIVKERKTPQESCTNMFTQWLGGCGHQPATWRVLVEVFNKVDQRRLANLLKDVLRGLAPLYEPGPSGPDVIEGVYTVFCQTPCKIMDLVGNNN